MMLTDIEIAQSAKLLPVAQLAEKLGVREEELEPYGRYKAKLSPALMKRLAGKPDGKLILVTAINPTPAGEGKTTTTVGLGEAMAKLQKNAVLALREPSLGPVFGIKGGAAGGGYAQAVPMEDINLHFTGDMHAITAANNLLCACIDNHLQQGNALGIDPRRIVFKRCMDMNDRALRNCIVGLGGKVNGVPREDHFQITVASEVMAILCLAEDLADLKKRLGRILVAYKYDNAPVYADDLGVTGAMAALLKDAIKPNLVQTLENTPNLTIRQSEAAEILTRNGKVSGVRTTYGEIIPARAAVLATGVYLNGAVIADLSREFLNTNGAVKHAAVSVDKQERSALGKAQFASLKEMAASLKCASRRGLTERFDGSIGAASVLMPFGGKTQRTPAQAMAALLPVLPGQETDQASVMAWGFDPDQMSVDPYAGAYSSVTVSLAKLVAAGGDYEKAYLTFQEFFEKLRDEPQRWGKPFSALLGALEAQLDYGRAAIGGKDSMSGSFLDKDVPPTLISFAIAPVKAADVLSPEFKEAGHPVVLFAPADGTPAAQKAAWDAFEALRRQGKVKAAWAVENGVAEAVMNMSFGNQIGFQAGAHQVSWYLLCPGAIVAELTQEVALPCAQVIGHTTQEPVIDLGSEKASVAELLSLNENVLEKVYPNRAGESEAVEALSWDKRSIAVCKHKVARPKAVIPVFPGTNCEYDTAQACLRAGIEPEIIVIRNLSTDLLAQSAQALEKAIRSARRPSGRPRWWSSPAASPAATNPTAPASSSPPSCAPPPCPTRSWTCSATGTA